MLPIKDNIPTRAFPIVTVVIIVINVIVYFGFEKGGFGEVTNDKVVVHYSTIPYEITHPGKLCGEEALVGGERQPVESKGAAPLCEGKSETFVDTSTGENVTATVEHVLDRDQPPWWATIFTSMFMHGSLLHILGNMLFLWIFGNNVEDSMGHVKFVLFYLLGGVAADLAHVAAGPDETIPTLGASGAIAAVLGGYALLFPRAKVITLIFIIFFVTLIELPALLVLGAWLVLQFLDASAQPVTGGGVAVWAHIGGFVFGLITIKLFASRYDPNYDQHSRLPVY